MEPLILNPDPESLNQRFTLTVPLDTGPLQADVRLRYLAAPGKWFLTLVDGVTDETLVNMTPLVACRACLNDLFRPWRHRGIGSLFCRPVPDRDPGGDPGENNLGDFQLIWSEMS